MRGILDVAVAIPHWTLSRGEITAFLGSGGGKGTRSAASYDEDAITLAVQAARRISPELRATASSLLFGTTSPVYLERSHASLVHAASGIPRSTAAADISGLRAGSSALSAALGQTNGIALITTGDLRGGLPGGSDESAGGDAGAAVAIGEATDTHPVLATVLHSLSLTSEYLDRWRVPGAVETRMWEERFGENQATALGKEILAALLTAANDSTAVAALAVSNVHTRVPAAVSKTLQPAADRIHAPATQIGFCGASDVLVALAAWMETAAPGDRLALISIADGADAFLVEATPAIATWAPRRSVESQLERRGSIPYGRYLSWRGILPVQPPNRPEPARMSAPAADRRSDWKYGLVGSKDDASGAIHLPPARVSWEGGATDSMQPIAMADTLGTVVTYTVDRLVWSPSPPVIFAVVDFDGGGRVPIELTDCSPEDISVGTRVEMTFRKINASDGISNYFWKARPLASTASASDIQKEV